MRGGFRHFFSSKSVFVKHPNVHLMLTLREIDLTQTLLRHLVKKMVSGASDGHRDDFFKDI